MTVDCTVMIHLLSTPDALVIMHSRCMMAGVGRIVRRKLEMSLVPSVKEVGMEMNDDGIIEF